MKVLIADMCGCKYPDIGYQIKSNFESLGHTTIPFDYRKFKLQKINFTNWILNKNLINLVKSKKPDVLIVNKGESLLPGTITSIKKYGTTTINWNPDEPFGTLLKFNKLKNISEYDAFFTYDLQYLDELKKLNPNSYYLPACADLLNVHKEQISLKERQNNFDICMVGTAYENRIKLLTPYTEKYKLFVAGPAWNNAPTSLRNISSPSIKINEMIRKFNESKIIINPYGEAKGFIIPNPRTFEIPASRSFQLTDARRDIDKFFKIGKEIIVYKNETDFKELIDYYIDNNNERNEISQQSYERVLKEHTMQHRLKEMLKIVNKI